MPLGGQQTFDQFQYHVSIKLLECIWHHLVLQYKWKMIIKISSEGVHKKTLVQIPLSSRS